MEPWERMLGTLASAWTALGRCGGRWVEDDGVGALVMPTVPERSLVNSVIYQPGADVGAAYERLEDAYREAQAWTVWVPDHDRATAGLLEDRGHKLDASPAAMMLDLDALRLPERLPEYQTATPERVGRVNDAAYPMRDGTLDRAMRDGVSPDDFHLYSAGDACVLGIHDHDGDAGVFFVATLPDARGRGLAAGLMAAALLEARERGCEVSTLQATTAGAPVYQRLGYQTFGVIEMWQKRA